MEGSTLKGAFGSSSSPYHIGSLFSNAKELPEEGALFWGSSWFCLVLILPGSLAWNPLNLLSAELVGGQHWASSGVLGRPSRWRPAESPLTLQPLSPCRVDSGSHSLRLAR